MKLFFGIPLLLHTTSNDLGTEIAAMCAKVFVPFTSPSCRQGAGSSVAAEPNKYLGYTVRMGNQLMRNVHVFLLRRKALHIAVDGCFPCISFTNETTSYSWDTL